ncbi:MAG: DUF4293 domain-containing protein [Bacteroidota bacterium]|nr:DUF4293 domain-containing protein [Bacteroidota bacterium]
MIQRIQSVYLFLTALVAALFLRGSILTFNNNSGAGIMLNTSGIYQLKGTDTLHLDSNPAPVGVIIALIIAISVAAIFLYRKRKLQMKLTIALIILVLVFIGALVYCAVSVVNNYHAGISLNYKMFLPIVMIILAVLAYRGIKKDEELVRSYDRLR